MIQSQTIKILKTIIIYAIVLVSTISNVVNYFYSYLYLKDSVLQWRLAMISIAIVLFFSSLYIWLNESLKQHNNIKIILSGWLSIYLFINFIGVCIGYTLHTKGFMMLLFTIIFFGFGHIIVKIWQKCY